jgi:hypothetical protein
MGLGLPAEDFIRFKDLFSSVLDDLNWVFVGSFQVLGAEICFLDLNEVWISFTYIFEGPE